MTEARVTWQSGMRFTGEAGSGFEVPLGGEKEGFRPMELFALGLASCTAMDVKSILEKKRQEVTEFQVSIVADRADEHPKVFTHARIIYRISGHTLDEEAVRRSIELSATRFCPAQAMLKGVFPVDLDYEIYEDQGGGKSTLVSSGSMITQ
jgi:putative redox protein